MIGDMFDGLRLILDLITKRDVDRRLSADILDKIADTLKLAIEPARIGGKISIEHLEEIVVYCSNFDKIIGSSLKRDTITKVNNMLLECCDVEYAYIEENKFNEFLCFGNEIKWTATHSANFENIYKVICQHKAYANILRISRSRI